MESTGRRTDRKLPGLNKLHAWLPAAAATGSSTGAAGGEVLGLCETRWLLKGLQMTQLFSFSGAFVSSHALTPDGWRLDLFFPKSCKK